MFLKCTRPDVLRELLEYLKDVSEHISDWHHVSSDNFYFVFPFSHGACFILILVYLLQFKATLCNFSSRTDLNHFDATLTCNRLNGVKEVHSASHHQLFNSFW